MSTSPKSPFPLLLPFQLDPKVGACVCMSVYARVSVRLHACLRIMCACMCLACGARVLCMCMCVLCVA